MILPLPSTSKKSKADCNSSSVTSTPPRLFLGTRSGAFFGPSRERRGMVVVLPTSGLLSLVRGGAEPNCCSSRRGVAVVAFVSTVRHGRACGAALKCSNAGRCAPASAGHRTRKSERVVGKVLPGVGLVRLTGLCDGNPHFDDKSNCKT